MNLKIRKHINSRRYLLNGFVKKKKPTLSYCNNMQHIIHYPFTYLKLSKPTPYQLWCMVLLRPCKCRPATRLTDSLCVSAGHPPHCWNSVPVINTRELMNRGQGVDKLSVNSVGHVEFTVDYLQHTSSCCAFFFIS